MRPTLHPHRLRHRRAFVLALLPVALIACGADIVDTEQDDEWWSGGLPLVVVRADAHLHAAPDLDAGSFGFYPAYAGEGAPPALVLEWVDRIDGWVRVRSPDSRRFQDCAGDMHHWRVLSDVVWEGWIREEAIVPVLSEPVRVTWDDGTWAELKAGTMVEQGSGGELYAIAREGPTPESDLRVPLEGVDAQVAETYPRVPFRSYVEEFPRVSPPLVMTRSVLGGRDVPPYSLSQLIPVADPMKTDIGYTNVFAGRCTMVNVHGLYERRRMGGGGARCRRLRGRHNVSVVLAGASVRSPNGDVVGHLPEARRVESAPHVSNDGFVCFDADRFREEEYRQRPDDDVDSACSDCVCFHPIEVLVDPIWEYRRTLGADVVTDDDRDALITFMEAACDTCTYAGDARSFFAEQNEAASLEIAVLAERLGWLRWDELIVQLRAHGESDVADRLKDHYAATYSALYD